MQRGYTPQQALTYAQDYQGIEQPLGSPSSSNAASFTPLAAGDFATPSIDVNGLVSDVAGLQLDISPETLRSNGEVEALNAAQATEQNNISGTLIGHANNGTPIYEFPEFVTTGAVTAPEQQPLFPSLNPNWMGEALGDLAKLDAVAAGAGFLAANTLLSGIARIAVTTTAVANGDPLGLVGVGGGSRIVGATSNAERELALAANSVAGGPTTIYARDAVDLGDFSRLNVPDPAIGKLRPGEAGAAAELENYLGGTLQRAPGESGVDFIFDSNSGVNSGKSVDFLLTPDSAARANGINQYFSQNLEGFNSTLLDHVNGADIVPIDTRFLTPENVNLLKGSIGNLPPELQAKIILFK
nr:hypothetical protein [Solimonas marina]